MSTKIPHKHVANDKLPGNSGYIGLGCDPELFVIGDLPKGKGKGVIGAERIMSEPLVTPTKGRVVLDGVQIELNPNYSYCREILSGNVANTIRMAAEKASSAKCKLSLTPLVEMDPVEMERLSERSKMLGCNPSFTIYKNIAPVEELTQGHTLIRSLGGHIHLSSLSTTRLGTVPFENPERTVKVLDVMLGIPCVMLDQDPLNAKRRELYGRAGEYRFQGKSRLEYRTLSSFWLRSRWLTSLVFGLARDAMAVAANTGNFYYTTDDNPHWVSVDQVEKNRTDELFSLVNFDEVQQAINTNDVALATKIFNSWIGWFQSIVGDWTPQLNSRGEKVLRHMAQHGYAEHLPQNYDQWLYHWNNTPNYEGWHHFVNRYVFQDAKLVA